MRPNQAAILGVEIQPLDKPYESMEKKLTVVGAWNHGFQSRMMLSRLKASKLLEAG